MKALLLAGAFVVCLLTILNSGPGNASPLSDVIDATRILYQKGSEVCSAQFVRSDDGGDYLLTANHCIDAKAPPKLAPKAADYSIEVRHLDDEWNFLSATVYYLKEVSSKDVHAGDVAVMRLLDESAEFPVVDICTEAQYAELKVGDDITVVGYPVGYSNDLYISEGNFLGETPSPSGDSLAKGRWLKTSAPLDGGSSGGGLYMERSEGDFCLLGTTSFKDPGTVAPMSYFSHPKNLHAILRGVLAPGEAAEPGKPIASESVREILGSK